MGCLALGVMSAVLALPTPALGAVGSGDSAGLTDLVADGGGKNNNKNKGAKKSGNRSNRSAKKSSGNNGSRGANRNSNRSNRGANRNSGRNNRGGNNASQSSQTRRMPVPNFMKNSTENHPHYKAMGKDHADAGRGNSRGSNRSHGKKNNSRGSNKSHNNNNGHKSHKNHGNNNHGHNSHKNHGNNKHRHSGKKHVTKNYYGGSYGRYAPRSGVRVYIGTGNVYAGYSSSCDPYYDDSYCRTTTYTRYGHNGTSTYRRTTCSSNAYGGYSHSPVYVNKTYVYTDTDYDDYRDFQRDTYSSNRSTAPQSEYTQVVPAEPKPERVGMVGPWADLVNSEGARAQDIFDQIARDYPEDGLPQLGYAVASAQRGQFGSAAAAVERAVGLDPASLDRMPDSVALRDEIRGLAEQIRRSNDSGMSSGSRWTAVAAFEYMSGDLFRARASLEQASQAGADSEALRGLGSRIGR
jgi:hypothetical protein